MDEKTFWGKVDIQDDLEKCWEWIGWRADAGYGMLQENAKRVMAHRKAWELHNKAKIPKGMVVRHTCDNTSCCNPHHLIIGTQRDNMRDKVERNNLNAPRKLGEEDVLLIYRLHVDGMSNNAIAKHFGVTGMNISQIVRGNSWRYLYPELATIREEVEEFNRTLLKQIK